MEMSLFVFLSGLRMCAQDVPLPCPCDWKIPTELLWWWHLGMLWLHGVLVCGWECRHVAGDVPGGSWQSSGQRG